MHIEFIKHSGLIRIPHLIHDFYTPSENTKFCVLRVFQSLLW